MARDFLAIFDINLRQYSQLSWPYFEACGRFLVCMVDEHTTQSILEGDKDDDAGAKIE